MKAQWRMNKSFVACVDCVDGFPRGIQILLQEMFNKQEEATPFASFFNNIEKHNYLDLIRTLVQTVGNVLLKSNWETQELRPLVPSLLTLAFTAISLPPDFTLGKFSIEDLEFRWAVIIDPQTTSIR